MAKPRAWWGTGTGRTGRWTARRDQLGDARSFSLDSPESRAPRVAAPRAAATR